MSRTQPRRSPFSIFSFDCAGSVEEEAEAEGGMTEKTGETEETEEEVVVEISSDD